jgi:SH3-like domain-containing protein
MTFTAWSEGTRVTVIAGPEAAQGRNWLQVRDEAGIEGWIIANYISIVR